MRREGGRKGGMKGREGKEGRMERNNSYCI